MTWKEYRNLLLSLALCLLSMLCIRILPSAFLWELVDAESFFRAQMLFLAAAFTAMLGVFLLEAGLLMLRFTMLSLVKGRIFSKVLSVLLVLGHGICMIVNVSLLIAGIAGIVLNGADPVGCVFIVLLAAMLVGGYVLIFWLEKRLKAHESN